jgi:hypothetical protein
VKKGHYHPENPAGIGYPERYEGLHISSSRKTPLHIALVKTTKGEIVLISPGYGHVTINPSPEEMLVKANLVSTAFVNPCRENIEREQSNDVIRYMRCPKRDFVISLSGPASIYDKITPIHPPFPPFPRRTRVRQAGFVHRHKKYRLNRLKTKNNRLNPNKNCSLYSFLQGVFEGLSGLRFMSYPATERSGEGHVLVM